MLQARDISVTYNTRRILYGVSLSLADGDILAVVGANGAGKSSLLKTLNRSIPFEGTIELAGRNLSDLSRREIAESVAVVAQENETRFPVTVLEFVLAGRFVRGGAFGWESEEDVAAAKRALAECDLASFESRLMNELSGGERQRVVLARAVATGAKLLLLDEPTANLDLAHQASMMRLVRVKCDEQGHSAIVVTHDLNLAAAFADQVIALKNGVVAASGTPAEAFTVESVRDFLCVDVMVENSTARGVRVTMSY